MSPKSLSPEELALLAGAPQTDRGADEPAPLQTFASDVRTPTPDSPPALRRKLDLRRIGGRHALLDADLASSLERLTGEPTSVQWLECEAVAFGQLLWTMPPPTCLGVVQGRLASNSAEFSETLAVQLELDLFFVLLDRLLQGAGSLPADARRPLTEVEQRLALRILKPLTAVWEKLWTSVSTSVSTSASTDSILSLERVLSHPQRLQAWSPEAPLVVNRYRVHGDGVNGTLQLIAPWEAVSGLLDQTPAPRRAAESHVIQEQLPTGEWSIELREQSLADSDLAALQLGDVLATDHPLSQPLHARGPSGVIVPVQIGRQGDERAAKRV